MIRVLMVGYNGANNTGAEALLLSDIEDVRAVLGNKAHITVPTLNETNLRRYLKESDSLRIAPMPTLYFTSIRRMVRESDLVLLVEGSTYMDSWGSPLLWAFLWAAYCAAEMGKPCLAYAVDAGTLKPANAKRVSRIASRTDLIITRNCAAAGRLRDVGVTAPILHTADNAFTFQSRESDRGWLFREWPRAGSGVLGLAPNDFYLWPVVMRLWGPKQDCYKWPYYFSSSQKRREESETLARAYADMADKAVERTGKAIALICMEQVDEAIANSVRRYMVHKEDSRIFSAREQDASRMTELLRSLDLLITSRYHAAVLSLAAAVPQIAVGHDTRLEILYRDLGLRQEWFLLPNQAAGLNERVERLLAAPELQREALRRGYAEHLVRAMQNRRLLAEFINRYVFGETQTDKGGMEWVA